jgi:hypothetical protein
MRVEWVCVCAEYVRTGCVEVQGLFSGRLAMLWM